MGRRKYTLPRHTNVSNQGPRIGAFLIDLAIAFAITLIFFFGVFRFVFNFKTAPLEKRIREERISSHLFYEDENGKLDYFDYESENEPFIEDLNYFYCVYIPAQNPDNASDFTIEWFNKNVLQIEGDGKAYFEYDGGNKDVVGIIKTDANKEDVNKYLQNEWMKAAYNLNQLPSFRKLNNEFAFFNTLEFVISGLIATTVTYVIIPICFKDGTTVGKKVFGLCLADSDGYKMRNSQLAMRVMPIDVLLLALLIPIWNTIWVVLVVYVVVFLVSFALAMASPKRSSLHDFTARTIVVNARTSILFETSADEEEYTRKEDNGELIIEDKGEEPELRYEK